MFKRTYHIILVLLLFCLSLSNGFSQSNEVGIPVVQNFLPAEYGGHTQNFDVAEDSLGNIYLANFAGILIFDGERWRLELTSDISRVTKVESDARGNIFVGGLNEIGKLSSNARGELRFTNLTNLIPKGGEGFGEVVEIVCQNNKVLFFTRQKLFILTDNEISTLEYKTPVNSVIASGSNIWLKGDNNIYTELNSNLTQFEPSKLSELQLDIVSIKRIGDGLLLGTQTGLYLLEGNQINPFSEALNELLPEKKLSEVYVLANGSIAIATNRGGVYFLEQSGIITTHLDRSHGLQNNYVNHLFQDSKQRLWAALNNGVSLIAYPWPWTKFERSSGLSSGVVSLTRYKGKLLAGTYQGLLQFNEVTRTFESIYQIETACWDLEVVNDKLYVATSEGLFQIQDDKITHLTEDFSLCIAANQTNLFVGTLDGFTQLVFSNDGELIKTSNHNPELGQITEILLDKERNVWLSTLNGKLALSRAGNLTAVGKDVGLPEGSKNKLYAFGDDILVNSGVELFRYNYDSKRFETFTLASDSSVEALQWSGHIYNVSKDHLWLTKGDETNLSLFIRENSNWNYEPKATAPFNDFICRAVFEDENGASWFGGPGGLIRYNPKETSGLQNGLAVSIVEVGFKSDSILYSGFSGDSWLNDRYNLGYEYRDINILFTSKGYESNTQVQYSIKMDGLDGDWSAWTYENKEEYQNLSPGQYSFRVKAKDVYGNISKEKVFKFSIDYPWYQRWYMILVYLGSATLIIIQITRWRLRRLLREKEKLEDTITERTAEIRNQRDEIQAKSTELGKALNDLKETQNELIRKEKLASVGQMTKGIVDRIINPLNYINNFSSLSEDLAKELKEVIEDEKENISEDGYDEILDINSMLSLNLEKIKDHGTSSVRIVKGMEELLKDRTGNFSVTDINLLFEETRKRLRKEYEKEIEKYGIEINIVNKLGDLGIESIQDELTKAVHELLNNATQAVIEKAVKIPEFKPSVSAVLTERDNKVVIEINDNGMGIPDLEMDKIFDPFFTTKPTAKGNGVGLYLVREIIYLHQGKILVKSQVNEKTTFIVELPVKKDLN